MNSVLQNKCHSELISTNTNQFVVNLLTACIGKFELVQQNEFAVIALLHYNDEWK